MAQIKIMPEQQRISPRNPVPVASSSRARIAGESGQALARGITSLAGAATNIEADILNKQRRASEMKAKTAFDSLSRNAYQDAVLNAKADGSDIRELYQGAVDNGRPKVLEGLEESIAVSVENYANRVDGHADSSLFNKGLNLAQKDIVRTYDEASNIKSALIQKSPELAAQYAESFMLDAFTEPAEGGTAALDAALKPQYANKFANDMLNGLYAKGKHNSVFYQKGLALLDSSAKEKTDTVVALTPGDALDKGLITPEEASKMSKSGEKFKLETQDIEAADKNSPLATMLNSLDGKQRASWINRFQSGLKEKKVSNLNELRLKSNDLKTIMKGVKSAEDIRRMEPFAKDLMSDILNNTSLKPDMKLRAAVDLQSDIAAANKSVEMRRSPRIDFNKNISDGVSEIDKVINETASQMGAKNRGLFIEATKERYEAKLMGQASQILKEQQYDSASYIDQVYPETKTLRIAAAGGDGNAQIALSHFIESRQNYLGVPVEERRFITKSDSAALSDKVKSSTAIGEGSSMLDAVQKQYGANFKDVMADMIKDDAIPAGIMIAANMSDPNARNIVMNTYKDSKEIKKEFKSVGSDSDLKKAVAEETSQFRVAIHQHSHRGSKYVNGFSDLVTTETQRLFNQDPSKDISDVAKTAYTNIIEKNFQNAKGFNSNLMLPNNDRAGNPISIPHVESYLKAYSDPETLAVLEPDLRNVVPANDLAGMKPEEKDQTYQRYLKVLTEEGKWKVDPSFGGIVFTLRGNEVKNSSGDPIKQSFDTIGMDAPSVGERRSFVQGVMNFLSPDFIGMKSRAERTEAKKTRWEEYYRPADEG